MEVVSHKHITCAGFMLVMLASSHMEYVICKKDGLVVLLVLCESALQVHRKLIVNSERSKVRMEPGG